jgi:hypothetical protein
MNDTATVRAFLEITTNACSPAQTVIPTGSEVEDLLFALSARAGNYASAFLRITSL